MEKRDTFFLYLYLLTRAIAKHDLPLRHFFLRCLECPRLPNRDSHIFLWTYVFFFSIILNYMTLWYHLLRNWGKLILALRIYLETKNKGWEKNKDLHKNFLNREKSRDTINRDFYYMKNLYNQIEFLIY